MKSLLQPDEVRLLAEVGFLAADRGDLKSARTIFGALEVLRPHKAAPYVGQAMALMNRRDYDEALAVLERGAKLVPMDERPQFHALRAAVLQLAGRNGESQSAIRCAEGHPLAQALGKTPIAAKR